MGLGRIGRGAHRKLDRRRLLSASATSISASVVLLLTIPRVKGFVECWLRNGRFNRSHSSFLVILLLR